MNHSFKFIYYLNVVFNDKLFWFRFLTRDIYSCTLHECLNNVFIQNVLHFLSNSTDGLTGDWYENVASFEGVMTA